MSDADLDARAARLNTRDTVHTGAYVLYWMQQAQREHFNHALELAVREANRLDLPVVAYFGLTDDYPGANLRHYQFMLEGLADVQTSLLSRDIRLVIRRCNPDDGVVELGRNAALVVADAGYLRIQRQWRRAAARRLECPLIEVETDVVVPVSTASPKEEYTAGTFRPKITRQIPEFLRPLRRRSLKRGSIDMDLESIDVSRPETVLRDLDVDRSVQGVEWLRGGTTEAQRRFSRFLADDLPSFADLRNDPAHGLSSNMSPYLHFGQVSVLSLVLDVLADEREQDNEALIVHDGEPLFVPQRLSEGAQSFLEELIVRRELSMNFVTYNSRYDDYQALPGWALRTLADHRADRRTYSYDLERLEAADTHDEYWNAAQTEMVNRGKMHGYMRMYWGKKVIEWSAEPEEAFRRLLYLNNRYFLDGRDANSFAGVAWCFGKHDRAWKERPVFGKVRYMNDRGLNRKFDMASYINRVRERR